MAKDNKVGARAQTDGQQRDSGRAREAEHGGPTEHREPRHKPGEKPSSQGQAKPIK